VEEEQSPEVVRDPEPANEDGRPFEEQTHEGELVDEDLNKGQRQIGVTRISSFSGPLPPPDILQKYKDIQPDFPERILKLTEQEAVHRREITRKALRLEAIETFLGQLFGLVVALAAFSVTAYLGSIGHSVAASIIGSGAIVALVTAFIKGRNGAKNEKESDED
jgi:uncharacterized membrane protein